MRVRVLFAVASIVLCGLLLVPGAIRGQGKKSFGGGFPGGGFPGGGGGFPGGGKGGGDRDPNQMFDFLARGRNFFLVTDTQRLREPLTQYLAEKGINNGQVTRELFASFNQQMAS